MGSRIETLQAHFVDPVNMDPADVRIKDIAHALAHQCRFNGYTKRHYSVAEHSVYVSRLVERRAIEDGWTNPKAIRDAAFQALMHDATEAYLVDIPRPLKSSLVGYKESENQLWAVICAVYGIPTTMHPFVTEADMRICSTEKLALMSPDGFERPEWADLNKNFRPYEGDWDIIDRYAVQPAQARRRFIDRFNHLGGKCAHA